MMLAKVANRLMTICAILFFGGYLLMAAWVGWAMKPEFREANSAALITAYALTWPIWLGPTMRETHAATVGQ